VSQPEIRNQSQNWLAVLISTAFRLKKQLDKKRFTTDAKVKQAVTSLLHVLDTSLFYVAIEALVSRLDLSGE
jgi:uncharacterized membrane-anchored protein